MKRKQFIVCDNKSSGVIAEHEYMSSSLYEEKKSKFYSYIFEIQDARQANDIVSDLKKHFKDARHVVYAYTLENEYYCSDDGEPSGTGGKAIYALLEKQKAINTLVIVVRYFGGILLGVGPLSRAYIKAAKLAEENLELVDYIPRIILKIQFDYNEESNIRNIIDKIEAKIINVEYNDKVIYNISIKNEEKEIFNNYIIV